MRDSTQTLGRRGIALVLAAVVVLGIVAVSALLAAVRGVTREVLASGLYSTRDVEALGLPVLLYLLFIWQRRPN